MPRFFALWLLALVLPLAACDAGSPDDGGGTGFDPAGVDYDAVASLDYDAYVRPLLAARNVLAPTATDDPGNPADYDLMDVVMAGPSGFVVPFDAEGSLLVRFAEDLPDSVALPLPNVRRLEADEVRYLKRWIEAGARDGDTIPFADATDLLFAGVQGENQLVILDGGTGRLLRRIYFDDLGIPSAPYGPHHVAFEPDGSVAYVSLISAGVVARIRLDLSMDPASPDVLLGRTPDGAFATPGMLSLDATSNRLYVGRSTLSDPLATGFGIIDRATMDVEVVATPFNVPHAMALTPDGRFAITAELTGTQARSRVAVYDAQTGDLALVPVPADGTPREFIHASLLGVHHGMMATAALDPAQRAALDPGYPYTVTLTSRSTDEVLFFSLAADGTLTRTDTAPAGDGPYHAHASHDGTKLLVPDQRGDTVTILDATTHRILRTIDASAPAGPLSQPHSPAPGLDDTRFAVTSSNLDGVWVPPFRFLGPADPDGVREPLPAAAFGNVAFFTMDGSLIEVVQLGAYPSGLEPFRLAGGMDHGRMDHGAMHHDGEHE